PLAGKIDWRVLHGMMDCEKRRRATKEILAMKPIRLTHHAQWRCDMRGTNEKEVIKAVKNGLRRKTKKGRFEYRLNFQYNSVWRGRSYAIKQVVPIVIEKADELLVVTVLTYFF